MVRMSADFQQTSVFCQTAMQMADPGTCWEFFEFFSHLPQYKLSSAISQL